MIGTGLPLEFQDALLVSRPWPRNSILRTIDTYPKALFKSETLLKDIEPDLFEDCGTEWEIPIRDLSTASGKAIDKCNIHSHEKLREWLGLKFGSNTGGASVDVVAASKRDPKCRFICFYGMHSRAKLKLTRDMFADIMTFHQVMPAFLDFISVFGQESEPTDLNFSGFREQVVLANPPAGAALSGLGRSGKHYQLCYNLKCVALKSEDKEDFMLNDWSIRQAAFHHQFDVDNGNTLWIVVQGNLDIQQRFKDLTDKNARLQDRSFDSPEQCFRSSLSAHLMYCHWATEDWRWYIKWLEKAVNRESIMVVLGPSGIGHAHKTYTPQDIQDLQIWEEKARQVLVALEGNIDVMSALVAFYRRLKQDKSFPLRKASAADVTAFATQVGNIMVDFKMQMKRAEFLVRTISDRRELVVQHLQSQSASRTERLSRNMEQEQIMMLIITVVTLIYLPATFVSTFFSTDVIKYQDPDFPEGSYSRTAMMRWIQVTLPLTVVTASVAWMARKWMLKRRREEEFGPVWRSSGWLSEKLSLTTPAGPTLPLYAKSG